MSIIVSSGYGYNKRVCENVSSWFLNKFLSSYDIEVDIVHRGLKREFVYGWCSVQDCDEKPRSFLIELQTHLPRKNYIQTLLHELYHCYQHVNGDLRDVKGVRCWKGIAWKDDNYDEMPWEIEAHQKEKELYEQYLKCDVPPVALAH